MTAIGRTMGRGLETVGRGLSRGTARSRAAFTSTGLRTQVVVVLAAVALLVGGGAATLYYQVQRAEAAEAARAAASAVAAQRAKAILSYDYRTLQSDIAQAKASATGRLQQQYTQIASGVIAPRAKKQQMVNQSAVVASAVVAAEPERVVMLLFVNQATQSNQLKAPRIQHSEVRMTLKKVDGKWLVSGLQPLSTRVGSAG